MTHWDDRYVKDLVVRSKDPLDNELYPAGYTLDNVLTVDQTNGDLIVNYPDMGAPRMN